MFYAGRDLKKPEEIPAWIEDCHAYYNAASDWIEDNLSYAECIRFRDLSGPAPSLPSDPPVNAHHAEHMENLARWLSNLRGIIRDYPPLR